MSTHSTTHSDRSEVSRIAPMVIVIIAVYAATQLLADVASLKIGVVFGWAVDMGTFIYPITFTLRDVAHRALGRRNTRVLIVAAAAINLMAVLFLIASAAVPSDEGWGLGTEYAAIFAPMWRIVVFSIVAQVASQLVNTEVYHWFATTITRRYQWVRSLVSNMVSIPVDNLIFVLGAFAWSMPWHTVWHIFMFNWVVKTLVMCLSLPLVYVTSLDRD